MSLGSKDSQSVDPGGRLRLNLPVGVSLHESPHIVTGNGITTELFRPEWLTPTLPLNHLIHVRLHGFAVSAWHRHELQTDHIFVVGGALRLVMFDGREQAPTYGLVSELKLGAVRPTLVRIPPGVWHGLQNLSADETTFLNYFDRPYCYENPDEWRLPADTDQIPYRFVRRGG